MGLTNLVVGKNAHRSYVLSGVLNQLLQFGELWCIVVTDELGTRIQWPRKPCAFAAYLVYHENFVVNING